MTSREAILSRARTALGRKPGEPPRDVPPARIGFRAEGKTALVALFCSTADAVGAKSYQAAGVEDACAYVAELLAGKQAIASNAPFLAECGVTALPGVRAGVTDKAELRDLCSRADVGISSADYALADTGTLVMLSSREEARMISLLPPVHIALVPRNRIVSGLDELLSKMPLPAEKSSSMVLITGTSRTGDIEQILVRGVHGPGEVHLIVV